MSPRFLNKTYLSLHWDWIRPGTYLAIWFHFRPKSMAATVKRISSSGVKLPFFSGQRDFFHLHPDKMQSQINFSSSPINLTQLIYWTRHNCRYLTLISVTIFSRNGVISFSIICFFFVFNIKQPHKRNKGNRVLNHSEWIYFSFFCHVDIKANHFPNFDRFMRNKVWK